MALSKSIRSEEVTFLPIQGDTVFSNSSSVRTSLPVCFTPLSINTKLSLAGSFFWSFFSDCSLVSFSALWRDCICLSWRTESITWSSSLAGRLAAGKAGTFCAAQVKGTPARTAKPNKEVFKVFLNEICTAVAREIRQVSDFRDIGRMKSDEKRFVLNIFIFTLIWDCFFRQWGFFCQRQLKI